MPNRIFRVGSGGTDTVADLKGMAAVVSNTNYATLESPIGTDYQVPVGKTFYVTKILFAGDVAGNYFTIGYGDTGVPDQVAAPTAAIVLTVTFFTTIALTQESQDVFFSVPASKFPFVKSSVGIIRLHVFGIEI